MRTGITKRTLCLFNLLMVLSLSACRQDGDFFRRDTFAHLEGKRIADSLFVGYPSGLVLSDTLLMYADTYGGQLITVYNLKTGESTRALNRGRGPGEAVSVRRITYDSGDRTVSLFDDSMHRVTRYSMDVPAEDLFSPAAVVSVTDLSVRTAPFEAVPFQGGYISNGNFEGQYQFARLDRSGENPEYFGSYPGDNTGADLGDAFYMKIQTLMAVKPDQSRFAAAGCDMDQLVFYIAREHGSLQKTREYFSIESRAEVTVSRNGEAVSTRMHYTPETVHTYQCLYPTDSYLYASYKGVKEKDSIGPAAIDTWVMKFSWDGQFISGYRVGNITDFAVDEASGILYAFLREDGENLLMAYSLS